MLLVDDTQIPIAGQGYVRYPLGGGMAHAGGSALLTRLLTNMRLLASNYRVMASTKQEDSLEVGGLKESQSISWAP